MKTIPVLLIIICCYTLQTGAQNPKPAVATSAASAEQKNTAPVNVKVMDMNNKIRKGEQVIFIAKKTKKEFKGISNDKGSFLINLPTGDTYEIKLKAIGDAMEYSSMEIPTLQPGQSFSAPFEVMVNFDPPTEFRLDHVYFDTGKSTLRKESFKELDEIFEYMKTKEEKIEISGHTDNVGDDASNQQLSQDRAEAIKTYLTGKGVKAERMIAKGYGSKKPVADNATPEGRQKNRRTEVRIVQ